MELLSIKITVENDFELMRPVSRNIFPHPPKLQNRMVVTAPGDKVPHKGELVHNLHFQRIFTSPGRLPESCRIHWLVLYLAVTPILKEVHALEWLLQHLPQDSLQMFIF